ncbi:MAG TPA: hypothetical protein PKC09_04425 [Paracoccus sp. (in: a-proteobacteria)]|uniref:hypothetical protein n=1 Tax=uncultured Paracoccus sp. TaxID=189685 RepID=UPI002630EBF7|nr:hypothetical protein [uncultured Paracoccus sp.]HMQ40497.1 hypothetical protein [Paracoccus sp. (in: a-proteobacteria)]HMR35058.1 hypothetical protein [Paracoccus sp. (in: a-proteobacteria)]
MSAINHNADDLERLRRGLVNPRPDIRVEQMAGAVASVEGDNAMGCAVPHPSAPSRLGRLSST